MSTSKSNKKQISAIIPICLKKSAWKLKNLCPKIENERGVKL